MKIEVLTLFPEMLEPTLHGSILGRALDAGHLEVNLTNIRDFTKHRHNCTDDYPFGGGAGMLMYAQPIVDAIEARDPEHRAKRIYLSPRGRTLNQSIVEELSKEESILLLCGHYEGVDQRALDLCIDEEMSIGDYVLTGGELGALVIIDSVSRLLPGVLGSAESSEDESFTMGLLEYPQYTRPAEFRGMTVPNVLLGGNHADIQAWRREQSLRITRERRPEMLQNAPLDDADCILLARMDAEDEAIKILASHGFEAKHEDFAEADAFPKRWFQTFVPEVHRKAAKKQCFSGRRHVGYLWQAFSMGFAPYETEISLHDEAPTLLYLPEKQILLRIARKDADARFESCGLSDYILTDDDMTFTYVQPCKSDFGPYFAKK